MSKENLLNQFKGALKEDYNRLHGKAEITKFETILKDYGLHEMKYVDTIELKEALQAVGFFAKEGKSSRAHVY
jgi:hypothetical protein